eukprot:TRINITY_DN31960_c0_g1_i1.p1 TRINITY_DN31960_c0_g1~~TRINITY_DN31960_c0_g1_i1.p1  ORF type:complete len:299 (+),score=37.44 TRINITY_DN31960_c0_g1_i1:49-897(+)
MEYVMMIGVALQVGLQPVVSRVCGKGVNKRAMVLTENIMKMGMCWSLTEMDIRRLDVKTSAHLAALPAIVYAVGGVLKLTGYENTDGITFNSINQTKIIFSAILSYLLLGKIQTLKKCCGLLCALLAAIIVSTPKNDEKPDGEKKKKSVFWSGIVPCFTAAILSGLGSILCQHALQAQNRESYLFTFELSFWSTVFLLPTLSRSAFSTFVSPVQLLPPFLQALGGILVGLVIKHLGGVAYGFCTVAGIVISGIADAVALNGVPELRLLVCVPLVIGSVVLYI